MNQRFELPAIWQGDTPLRCLARHEETHDSASFELAAASGQHFTYFPGQFITIGVDIGGKTHWRAYSISSSPSRPQTLTITVKRVPGGLVSNWLLDNWQRGMSLLAHPPAGEFGLKPTIAPQALALFSAGSGITPMMAITRWLLDTSSEAQIHFFHSARSEKDVIFSDTLQALAAQHKRLHLHLFLSRPTGGVPCHIGRLTGERLKTLLPDVASLHAWLCGQDAYMDDVTHWLQQAGVPEQSIYRESFTPPVTAIDNHAACYALSVPAFGKTAEIVNGETLLDVMEREGLPIIGACRTGVCGSCKCKVEAGSVTSNSAIPLTPEELAAGYVLACSSTAMSDLVIGLD